MRLVLDNNVLLTYFWKSSTLRALCMENKGEFFTPEFALVEFKKYARELSKRAGTPEKEFDRVCKDLFSHVTIIDFKDYKGFFKECIESFERLSEKDNAELIRDLDFLAVAHMLCCPLWTNDKLLRKQHGVVILDTKEVVSLLDVE